MGIREIGNLVKEAKDDVMTALEKLKKEMVLNGNYFGHVIENEKVKCENGKIKTRDYNIDLPNNIIGDTSMLDEEQKRTYVTVLKNSTQIDSNRNIKRVGILENENLQNIIGNKNDKVSNDLNILNQTIARHIIGLKPDNTCLRCSSLDSIMEYIGDKKFIKGYVDGSLIGEFKNSVGKIYESRIFSNITTSLGENSSKLPTVKTIKGHYKKSIDENLDSNAKFNKIVELISKEQKGDLDSGFMAKQLIELGFIACENKTEYIEQPKEFRFFGN